MDSTPTELADRPLPATADTSGGGCLRALGQLAVIAVIVVLVAGLLLYLSLASAFRAPQARPAPVAWEHRQVHLSAGSPSTQGTFVITARGFKPSLTAGVTAGVPSTSAGDPTAADGGPAALLSGPAVRVTVNVPNEPAWTCLAPCELPLPASVFDCSADPCRLAGDVRIELIAPGGGEVQTATVDIAAGLSAALADGLPDRTSIELDLADATSPEAS